MTTTLNRISAFLVALLGIVVWWLSTGFPTLDDGHPGPAFFPQIIAVGLIVAAIGLLIMRLDADTETREADGSDLSGWLRLGLGVLLVVIFPWMREYLGFVASLSILGLAIAIVLKSRLVIAIPVVVVSAFLVYWLFTRLLGVPL